MCSCVCVCVCVCFLAIQNLPDWPFDTTQAFVSYPLAFKACHISRLALHTPLFTLSRHAKLARLAV